MVFAAPGAAHPVAFYARRKRVNWWYAEKDGDAARAMPAPHPHSSQVRSNSTTMKILILGAGYAGLRAALDLDQLMRGREDVGVTLVDQFPYHQLIQLLHLTASAGHHSREAIYDLKRLLRDRAIGFVQGRAAHIDAAARLVHLDEGAPLAYDKLIIALGAETAYYDIPGAREYTLPLRTYPDALKLRDHLIDQFIAAGKTTDPTERRILLTTAIVGAGYTGGQFAGELAAWADDLCERAGVPRGEARIALLEQTDQLFPQFGAWAAKAALARLDQLGVSVYLNTGATAVEPRLLRVSDGRVLRAATIVWAAGIQGPALLADSGLPVTKNGRVKVDRYLRVEGQAAIFALGDCALIPDPAAGSNATVPTTASYALRQGSHIANSIAAEIAGEAPRAYEPLRLGELVSIGPDYALGSPLGVPVTGYPAYLLKKGVEQYYRATIES
jgi:NADH:ubiquinone reductase (H+-translocating)